MMYRLNIATQKWRESISNVMNIPSKLKGTLLCNSYFINL